MDDISLKSRDISTDNDDMTRVDEGNGLRRSKRIKEILNTSVYQDDNHEDDEASLVDETNIEHVDEATIEHVQDEATRIVSRTATSNVPRMRFLPSETPRLEALSHFMQFDLSSNNVGQCDGCGMWNIEKTDSGNRREHYIGPRGARLRVDMSLLLSLQSKKWLELIQ